MKLVRPFYTLGDDDDVDDNDDDDDDLCGHLKSLLAKLHACETSRYLNVHSMGFQCPSFWPDGFLHMLSKKRAFDLLNVPFTLQIKLLLQQQNAELPHANPLLTPPRTPHTECSQGNSKPTDDSPVSMVTVCTNTGASLLLGTPVKPNGKRSAATSPMKEKDMNNSRFARRFLIE